ncbi:MAG: hypothetical protein IJO32_03240 [Bacilli bacterium]|nr:hypothetical protein [Bacilli bacterium]
MNNNVEFLNYISKNAEMGFTSIKDLIDVVKDEDLKKILKQQINEYENIYEEANKLLDNYDEEQKEINPAQKFTSYIMIKMNLLKDKSTSHIAEMMMKGSNMGIIDIEKKLNSFDSLDKKVNHLGEKLLKTEENNIEQLKPYLKEKE